MPKSLEQLTAKHTGWYTSNDEEHWAAGPFETREEAEEVAKGHEHRLITQATKGPVRVSSQFDVEEFIEAANEALYDMGNEDGDPIIDLSMEASNDLRVRVRAAIDEWQVAHQIAPHPWCFDSTTETEIAAWAKAEKGGAA